MSSTVDKALSLLKLVASSDPPLGLMEIASVAKVDKSTALRLLVSLSKHGFVSRDAQRRYHLGSGLLALASRFTERRDLRGVALPRLRALAAATRETASLHLLSGNSRVCIEGVEGPSPIHRRVPLGEVQPLHEGATGKVILAFLPAPSQEQYFAAANLVPAATDRIRRQLGRIRDQGYMAATDDRVPGASGLSAPLYERGQVCASITIAGPKERWTSARMTAFAPKILAAAADISDCLSDYHATGRPGVEVSIDVERQKQTVKSQDRGSAR
jgi:IclR family acetate operon transcriptional repressor